MEQKQHIHITLFVFLAAVLFNLSCTDDRADELTSIDYDRLFSPIGIEAFVINRTDARLSWTMNEGVASYSLELFADDSLAFAGTPVRQIDGITSDQLPYYIRNLEGSTQYSVRIKAVTTGMTDSKWSGVTFKTNNIVLNFLEGDVRLHTTTIRWVPGNILTKIRLEPGGIEHIVTADEIAAGSATLTDLVEGVTYTATLYNGDKSRGTAQFTTLSLGNATPVYPEDDFISLLASATEGDTLAFFPGDYVSSGEIVIDKSIMIKGFYPYEKPVIKGYFSLKEGAGLELSTLILDGTGTDGSQAIVFKTATVTYGALKVEGCEIRNYVKGLMYLNVVAKVESITFNNNLIYNIECNGGDFLDSRTGAFNTLTFTNNTVYNSVAGRDFIRYDDASTAFPGMTSTIFVDHNTLYGVCNSATKRLFYVRFKQNKITFTHNIVAETKCIFTNQANTDPTPTFGDNNYFHAPNLFSASGITSMFFDDSATSEDPGFTDAASGNFTVTNELLKAKGTGDPRWVK